MIRDLLRFIPHVSKYRGRLIWGVSLFLIARLFEASVPVLLGIGIDRLAQGRIDLALPIFGIVFAVASRFLIVSWARIAVRRVGFLVQHDLREKFYTHLQLMGPTFYGKFAVGDLMTRAIADIQLIRRLINMGTISVVIFVFANLVGFACMLYYSPLLTLMIIPPLPFLFLYTWRTSITLGEASRDVQERMSDMSAHVQENITGVRTIQAMVQEENEIQRFDQHNLKYSEAFYAHARLHSRMQAIMPCFTAISIVIVLGYGGHLVLTEKMSVGDYTAFFTFVHMVIQPFRVAGITISLLQRAAVASRRLFEIFDTAPEIKDEPKQFVTKEISGQLKVNNLSFKYPGSDQPVLKNISLEVAAGQTITIMGKIGSGKTTFLKQLLRLLDTPKNHVFIDGYDIRDYPLKQLRAQVAFVPQDAFLFGESLRSNITYDEPRRVREKIWDAAHAAVLDDTIDNMAKKLDTVVGERGVTLSGGQKQRTTVARGLIRDAPVLILDDCFASIDTETEELILQELQQLRANRTTILVSHRVSTAKHSDRIVIFDSGEIIEQGTHQELLTRSGTYSELERIQHTGANQEDYSSILKQQTGS